MVVDIGNVDVDVDECHSAWHSSRIYLQNIRSVIVGKK